MRGKMPKRKNKMVGTLGWIDGYQIKILAVKKFDKVNVYKVRFMYVQEGKKKHTWIEYLTKKHIGNYRCEGI